MYIFLNAQIWNIHKGIILLIHQQSHSNGANCACQTDVTTCLMQSTTNSFLVWSGDSNSLSALCSVVIASSENRCPFNDVTTSACPEKPFAAFSPGGTINITSSTIPLFTSIVILSSWFVNSSFPRSSCGTWNVRVTVNFGDLPKRQSQLANSARNFSRPTPDKIKVLYSFQSSTQLYILKLFNDNLSAAKSTRSPLYLACPNVLSVAGKLSGDGCGSPNHI